MDVRRTKARAKGREKERNGKVGRDDCRAANESLEAEQAGYPERLDDTKGIEDKNEAKREIEIGVESGVESGIESGVESGIGNGSGDNGSCEDEDGDRDRDRDRDRGGKNR